MTQQNPWIVRKDGTHTLFERYHSNSREHSVKVGLYPRDDSRPFLFGKGCWTAEVDGELYEISGPPQSLRSIIRIIQSGEETEVSQKQARTLDTVVIKGPEPLFYLDQEIKDYCAKPWLVVHRYHQGRGRPSMNLKVSKKPSKDNPNVSINFINNRDEVLLRYNTSPNGGDRYVLLGSCDAASQLRDQQVERYPEFEILPQGEGRRGTIEVIVDQPYYKELADLLNGLATMTLEEFNARFERYSPRELTLQEWGSARGLATVHAPRFGETKQPTQIQFSLPEEKT